MISYEFQKQTAFGEYIEGFCLTTDTKPVTGIANGSIMKELNASTGAVKNYMFNAAAATWVELT